MKKKELLLTSVLMPVVLGILICIVFILVAKPNIAKVIPINEGTEFAFFDSKADGEMLEQIEDSKVPNNSIVGYIKLIGSTLTIRYNSDYSNMAGALSLDDDRVHFGNTGCVYLRTLNDSGQILDCEKDIDIESVYGNFRYVLVDKFVTDNEFKARSTATSNGKSLVIYYQLSDGAGLSSKYKVLVYEEVE